MVQRRYFILTTLLLLIAGAGAHAQLPDGTIKISGIRPAEVRFTSDGRYFMAKLSDTLRIYETATGVQAGGIPVPKVDGYAAGFLAGDSTVLVMRYNWGLYYHVWNWRKGVLVDSQKVWRQVQWAHVLGSGRKMVIKVSETTDPTKQYEMWNTIGEATYLGSFLDKTFQGRSLQYDANGEYGASMISGIGPFGTEVPVRISIRPRLNDQIDTMHVSSQPFRVYRLSPDGSRLTVSRGGGLQYVFDGSTGDSLFTLDVPRKRSVIVSMDYTVGNRYLICAISPDTSIARLEIRDGSTGRLIQVAAIDSALYLNAVFASPLGDFVVAYPDEDGPNNRMLIVPLHVAPASTGITTGEERICATVDPNPAHEFVNAAFVQRHSGRTRLRLVGVDGHDAWVVERDEHQPGRYREIIPIEGIPAGAYFLLVEEPGGRSVVPVLIEH